MASLGKGTTLHRFYIEEIPVEIIQAMKKVEASHFRAVYDTGANLNALLIWNSLRMELGLPMIGREDLASYHESIDAYVMPSNSKLLK